MDVRIYLCLNQADLHQHVKKVAMYFENVRIKTLVTAINPKIILKCYRLVVLCCFHKKQLFEFLQVESVHL